MRSNSLVLLIYWLFLTRIHQPKYQYDKLWKTIAWNVWNSIDKYGCRRRCRYKKKKCVVFAFDFLFVASVFTGPIYARLIRMQRNDSENFGSTKFVAGNHGPFIHLRHRKGFDYLPLCAHREIMRFKFDKVILPFLWTFKGYVAFDKRQEQSHFFGVRFFLLFPPNEHS